MGIAKNVLLSCLIAGAASMSHAEVVDFNDVPNWQNGSFTTGGFDFILAGVGSGVFLSPFCALSCPSNDTMLVVAPYGNYDGKSSWLSMSKHGGTTFSLTSFQGTGTSNFNIIGLPDHIPKQIDVVGHVLGGATVTQSFAIDKSTLTGKLPLSTYTFNGSFTNLTSVTFSSSGSDLAVYNSFTIDNINVTAVPEPESYAMMLAGLGMLGGMARRRQRAA